MNDSGALEQAIAVVQAAIGNFVQGKLEAWKEIISRRDDASLFGGWGGWECGWEQLGPRYDWAAACFSGGEVTFEEIARYSSGDLACTVHLERMRARPAGGEETMPVHLRVTHILRREEDGWRLIHRHADNIVAVQPTESVIAS